MHAAPQMVSANEAAALATVEVRDVHRAFDERLLPEALLGDAGGGRQVARGVVPLLAFYSRTAGILQADARKAVIRLVAAGGRTGRCAGSRPFAAAAAMTAGLPLADILASYPSLTAEQVELAALYASVERSRGKPRRPLAERLPAGARLLSLGTVPRPAAPAA